MVQVSKSQNMGLVKANYDSKSRKLSFGRILGILSVSRQKTIAKDSTAELNYEAVGFGPLWSEYDMWI